MKRKQWMQLGIVASSMVLLTGCYQRYQRQSSPKKEIATSQTSAKKQAKKADNKQIYQAVFSDYQKIFATSKDLDAISKLNDELAKEDRMINSWVIETVINQPAAVRYAFKDLNSDGVDEMIIANQQSNGSYFVTGVYYLKDKKPTLLAEGFVAGHGGVRNATTLYKGGEVLEVSWLSGWAVVKQYSHVSKRPHKWQVKSRKKKFRSLDRISMLFLANQMKRNLILRVLIGKVLTGHFQEAIPKVRRKGLGMLKNQPN